MIHMEHDIQVSVIKNIKELRAIEDEWNFLLENIPDRTVFQTYLWHHTIVEAFGREKEMHVLTFREKGKLVGLLPLRIIARNIKIKKYKVLQFLTHGRADYQDVIISIHKKACLSAFLQYISSNKRLWDIIFLNNIPNKSKTFYLFKSILQSQNLKYQVQEGVVCPIINTVEGSFEDYTRGVKKKLINDIRRCERRLREKGQLTILRYSGEISLDTLTDAFIQQHMKRWGGTKSPSKFNKAEHRQYYRLLFQSLYNSDLLDLFYLKLDNKILAFHFGSLFNNMVSFHTPTFDPDYSKYSPSKILLLHIIESCFSRNISVFDFLAGAEQYKYDWSKKENKYVKILVFRDKVSKLIYEVFFGSGSYRFLTRYKRGL